MVVRSTQPTALDKTQITWTYWQKKLPTIFTMSHWIGKLIKQHKPQTTTNWEENWGTLLILAWCGVINVTHFLKGEVNSDKPVWNLVVCAYAQFQIIALPTTRMSLPFNIGPYCKGNSVKIFKHCKGWAALLLLSMHLTAISNILFSPFSGVAFESSFFGWRNETFY